MLYEKLNPVMQEMVDLYVQRLSPLSWKRRVDMLGEAIPAFAGELTADQAKTAARGFITAVLERLEVSDVDDPFQASLYLVSLSLDHQEAAAGFLGAHPEYEDAVQDLFGLGKTVH
ncbi:MAG: hypothetical protein QOJ16_4157 [Acidobacteriota bacterium]|jgi:hypothetical protein|nr:hypothetical protein [Acidobacteriota bacterium]